MRTMRAPTTPRCPSCECPGAPVLWSPAAATEQVTDEGPCCCSMGEGEGTFYTEWEETFESFDQMGLHENLLRGIYAYGT